MPRRDPVTRRHIEKRQKFGFGPRVAPLRDDASPPDNDQVFSCHYNFNEALEILGLADVSAERKRAYERELDEIIRAHWLALRVEDEETPARKAEAFHAAIRHYRRKEVEDKHRLSQSLEHELMKLQLATGHSVVNCCRALEDHYRSKSKLGRNKTYALRNTIHRLQAFASAIDEELTWMDRREASGPKRRAKATGRNIPVDLIRFVTAVLDAARIKHPSHVDSPSKFRRLMVGPRLRRPP